VHDTLVDAVGQDEPNVSSLRFCFFFFFFAFFLSFFLFFFFYFFFCLLTAVDIEWRLLRLCKWRYRGGVKGS
jgi:hypothetical protein